ncbi:MAG: EamA family transporter [Crocinitomicaceae bacterium]|nr:EamA family transporter [Crocinitomicaceae bacterium]
MANKTTYAHIALFTVGVIYALNYFIAKGLMPEKIGPSGFIALRVLGGVAMFFAARLFVKWERVERDDIMRLALCGLTGVAINQLCFFNGLALTSPLHAALIMTTNPIFVLVASALILGTSITLRKLGGITFGGLGAVALLLNSGEEAANVASSLEGDFLILVNALSYGVYLVVVKPLMTKYKPITVISWVFLFGSLFAVPVGYNQLIDIDLTIINTVDYWAIVYVIIGTTFLAYLLNIYALNTVEPTVVSIYIYLQPIIVTLLTLGLAYAGYTLYKGEINYQTTLSALAIFTGVWLVSIPSGYLKTRIMV